MTRSVTAASIAVAGQWFSLSGSACQASGSPVQLDQEPSTCTEPCTQHLSSPTGTAAHQDCNDDVDKEGEEEAAEEEPQSELLPAASVSLALLPVIVIVRVGLLADASPCWPAGCRLCRIY